jgi:hypothetical protein
VAAFAQAPRVELTPFGSYRFEGDFDLTNDLFETDVEVDAGFAYGLALDVSLTRYLQLELLANRQESDLIRRGGLFGSDAEIADIEVSHLHVGVLGQFGQGQVHPFVVGSVGVARVDIDLPGLRSDDRFAASAGGGVKILLNDHFGFRIEGRYYYVDLDEDHRRDNDECDDIFDDDCYRDPDNLSQAEASFGLIFAW